ncbi:unnamed protein product, partial [Schistocephalus solidus]|uniref:Alpha-carbonic anhydrase domain-containing protein n=1 Tax=Schistocephalus solidus TaxID=70667 RepID=A0A183SEW4_SCHSO
NLIGNVPHSTGLIEVTFNVTIKLTFWRPPETFFRQENSTSNKHTFMGTSQIMPPFIFIALYIYHVFLSLTLNFSGESRRLFGLILKTLLPDTQEFMTYQGSLTFPACHESVTWILLNHAATVTEEQMKELRTLRMSEFEHSGPIADNFRPIQSTNNRFIRTNIHSMKDVSPF